MQIANKNNTQDFLLQPVVLNLQKQTNMKTNNLVMTNNLTRNKNFLQTPT